MKMLDRQTDRQTDRRTNRAQSGNYSISRLRYDFYSAMSYYKILSFYTYARILRAVF